MNTAHNTPTRVRILIQSFDTPGVAIPGTRAGCHIHHAGHLTQTSCPQKHAQHTHAPKDRPCSSGMAVVFVFSCAASGATVCCIWVA